MTILLSHNLFKQTNILYEKCNRPKSLKLVTSNFEIPVFMCSVAYKDQISPSIKKENRNVPSMRLITNVEFVCVCYFFKSESSAYSLLNVFAK